MNTWGDGQRERTDRRSNSTGRKVFDYIVQYKRAHDGANPPVRQIMRGVGLSSTSIVTYHIHRLIDQGLLYWIGDTASGRGTVYGVKGGRWDYADNR